jgi:hypothetical protein
MTAEQFIDEILTCCSSEGYVFEEWHAVTLTMIFVNTYRKFLCPAAGVEAMADLFAYFLPLIESRIREG